MISLIAAIGKNRELGKNNNLIWHLSEDLKFFKEITSNHKVIMGYNTYKSIGRPLPNRENIVLTHDKNKVSFEDIKVYDDIDELIKNEISEEEVFIIGGVSMYEYFLKYADRMYLTLIDAVDNEADVYFPEFNKEKWEEIILNEKKENNIEYKHVLYKRY